MFSGIKYIFGYTDETATQTVNDDATSPASQPNNVLSSSSSSSVPASIETSTIKLEQTLNAATTKFTEQLLPQQASIEQLQSSSHQLLPSIIEQHEEEELKKKSPNCDETAQVVGTGKEDDDDDDDGFNAESWELLDLVEKAENELVAPVSQTSSVQKDDILSQGVCKSTSGILKSQNTSDTNDNGTSQKRQKPKVSFEASDLVRYNPELGPPTNTATLGVAPAASRLIPNESAKNSNVVVVKGVDCKKVPILNYAKALSTKLETSATVNGFGKVIEPSPCASKSLDEGASEANGPVKRVRPARVSTSSWSSHDDDDDDIEQVDSADWEISHEKPVIGGSSSTGSPKGQAVDADDNESIISSGFSDCDYGFGCINDYVMRPKKANAKRTRSAFGGSGLVNAIKSARFEKKMAVAKVKVAAALDGKSESSSKSKSTDAREPKSETPSLSRNSKPKKKRMIMSTGKSANLSDFLKYRPGGSKEVGQQVAFKKVVDSSSARQTAPKPSISGGSTESSDIVEMDESWFVTPPPCFTGAAKMDDGGKVEWPKTKEADRENALIEHPTVYIANAASKSQAKVKGATAKPKSAGSSNVKVAASKPKLAGKSLAVLEDEFWNSGDDGDDVKFDDDDQFLPMDKVVVEDKSEMKEASDGDLQVKVVGGAGRRLASKMSGKETRKPTEKKAQRANSNHTVTTVSKPSENKAWRNKFIVDVWDLDDNDDVDSDFDNMFESSHKRKISTKTRKPRQKQVKDKKVVSLGSNEIASFEDDTSSSVELLSVKSLVSLEFENNENVKLPVVSLAEEKRQVLAQSMQKAPASQASKGSVENRRPPTQVRPIEPERVPSWQLKRQRSKRRPLMSASSVVNKQPIQQLLATGSSRTVKSRDDSSSPLSGSAGSSSRSTPTLIDRIGCSIVANLTNLTSGIVSSGAMNYCQASSGRQSSMMEGQERIVGNKSNLNNSEARAAAAVVARKKLSRGLIRRQNICAKQGNTLRRPDRRLKLFATPNGCSINRKVHTSIH